MASKKHQIIKGQFIDESTNEPTPEVLIEAWGDYDPEPLFVGNAITDDEGRFEIDLEGIDFYADPWESVNSFYFKIYCDIDLIISTAGSDTWHPDQNVAVRLRADLSRWRIVRKRRCKTRHIYLKIERIQGYSPVEPNSDAHGMYRRDCFRNAGHEDSIIPDNEVELRRLDALVYREYTNATYTVPKPGKIVPNDILEPPYYTRVPGTVIYTKPGERLCIEVFNCDDMPHSFHVHGLAYGIDSDGAYPFGVQNADGQRSDEICPGETWKYEFEVREDMVGCWPFHSHYRHTERVTNLGLFGGIVVRDPDKPKPDYEVPFFLHRMVGERTGSAFDSGTLQPSDTYSYTFTSPGTFDYYCRFHAMFGQIEVVAGAPMNVTVDILDGPGRYDPDFIQVAPGGTVLWNNLGTQPHTVTEQNGGGALESFCINGRTFEGNTPRIVAKSGNRIRWYVFNLDLGMMWHNFHTHAQRWKWGDEFVDTRSLGPAESFVADTIVPDVILPLCTPAKPGEKKIRLKLCANFPVHCHVEPHMMQGMTAMLRAIQEVYLTKSQIKSLGFELPQKCSHHGCPEIDVQRCRKVSTGHWEALPDSNVFAVHGAVLNTGKVVLFSGRAEQYHLPADYPLESALYDPSTNTQTNQPFGENLFCAGHTFLADGRLLVAGGDRPTGGGARIASTHVFDPSTETWSKLPNDMNFGRWYPTVVPLSDGRILAASGAGGPDTLEIFDPSTQAWTLLAGANKNFSGLYPSLFTLPNGEVFWSRTSWNPQGGTTASKLQFTGLNSGTWTDISPMQFYDRQEGASVILVDATVSPAVTHVYAIGGGVSGASNNPQSMERIDVTATVPAPSWVRLADMNFPRTNVNATILPNGKILVVGGQRNGKWAIDPQPVMEAEIYDPVTDTWTLTPAMSSPRQYHSVVLLLPDGRVLAAGGVDPSLGGTPTRDLKTMEMFYPPYLSGTRPTISSAPSSAGYGSTITVNTPDAVDINAVALVRPGAVTHHTDAGHRYIKIGFASGGASSLDVNLPSDAHIAPPGYYMLYLVNSAGIPSEAAWIQLT